MIDLIFQVSFRCAQVIVHKSNQANFLQTHRKIILQLMNGLDYPCGTQKWAPQAIVHFRNPLHSVPIVGLVPKSCQTIFDHLDFRRD